MIVAGTLLIDSAIGRRSTASFRAQTDTSMHFQQYQTVSIYDQNGILAFSGYVLNPKEHKPGFQGVLEHEISCIDQHFLADKRRIGASYTNRTVGYMVQDMVTTVLSAEGVTVGSIIDPGVVIPATTFVYCTVAEALDALVTAANASGAPYYWQIDQNKKLWFVPYTAILGPLPLQMTGGYVPRVFGGTLILAQQAVQSIVDGTQIDDGRRSGVKPSVTRANPTYRNTQYLLGGTGQTATQTNIRPGDGNTTAWLMDYAIATVPTISTNLNGAGYVAKTVGINGVDTGKDFYWNKGSNTITQDAAGTKLRGSPTLDLLKVVYTGQYPTIAIAQNDAQIGYEASIDGTTGIVEEVETDSTIASAADGLAEASNLLTRYATQGQIFEFATMQSGFAQGQLIIVNYAPFSLYNAQMLVEEVSASDRQDHINIWYTIKAILGPYDQTWQSFFGSLLATVQQANSINIGVSQQLLIALTGSVTLSPTMTGDATVYACPLPSSTLYLPFYPC